MSLVGPVLRTARGEGKKFIGGEGGEEREEAEGTLGHLAPARRARKEEALRKKKGEQETEEKRPVVLAVPAYLLLPLLHISVDLYEKKKGGGGRKTEKKKRGTEVKAKIIALRLRLSPPMGAPVNREKVAGKENECNKSGPANSLATR